MEASEFLSTSPSCAITSYARGATPQICCPPSGFANYNYTVGAILLRHMACRRNSQHAPRSRRRRDCTILNVVILPRHGKDQSALRFYDRSHSMRGFDVRLPISPCFFFHFPFRLFDVCLQYVLRSIIEYHSVRSTVVFSRERVTIHL